MTKEEVIERVKKLARLSESPNPHEAGLAMERARALLEKYRISQEDLDLDERDRTIIHLETTEHYESKEWIMVLLKAIEENNEIVCLVKKKEDKMVSINFIATEAAATVSVEMFRYLVKAANKRADLEYTDLKAARFNITDRSTDVFKRGFAHGVMQQILFEKARREEVIRQRQQEGCKDLMPVEHLKTKQRIEEELQNKVKTFDEFQRAPISTISDSIMASKGFIYGNRISLKKQIEANKNEPDFLP